MLMFQAFLFFIVWKQTWPRRECPCELLFETLAHLAFKKIPEVKSLGLLIFTLCVPRFSLWFIFLLPQRAQRTQRKIYLEAK